mmetsp:Transcript_52706/g.115183  ORF Transcript_52706/g.115183 Transcript_52706/m.115183 type:complete len:117 (+) Transcript_52706:230-580(+)
MMDQATQRSRGFGYVTYAESSSVEAAMATFKENKIDDKWVEVKRCIPQDKMPPGGKGKGKGKGMDYGGGCGMGGCMGGYGAPAYGGGYGGAAAYGGMGYGAPAAAYGGYGAYGAAG